MRCLYLSKSKVVSEAVPSCDILKNDHECSALCTIYIYIYIYMCS